MTTKINPTLLEDYFVFLDELRNSGITNMYGSAPYLAEEFFLDKKTAQEVVARWMETFVERHPQGR